MKKSFLILISLLVLSVAGVGINAYANCANICHTDCFADNPNSHGNYTACMDGCLFGCANPRK